MTPAQKKTQANFKKAIAYRQKTGCTLKEAFDYVKGGVVKGLDKVVKKGNKTTVLYTKKVAPKKKAASKKKPLKQGKLFGVTDKKTPVRNYGSHKDTKSHNVKISVISGNEKLQKRKLQNYLDNDAEIFYTEHYIQNLKNKLKNKNYFVNSNHTPAMVKKTIAQEIKYLKELKQHKTELKKLL